MAFSITLFIISWICFFIFADRRKITSFYPTCLLAMYLAAAVDFLATEHYILWNYEEGSNIKTYFYHLMQQFGVYPVVTYLFLQKLPKNQNTFTMIRYVFYWTLLAIFIEWLATKTGFMKYEKWWNHGWSYLCDWVLFFLFYFHYKWWEKRMSKSSEE